MTRLFADPIPARLVWDEGELTLLQIAGRRFTVVEVMRRWRVEAEWWKGGPARDYLTLRTADRRHTDAAIGTSRLASSLLLTGHCRTL